MLERGAKVGEGQSIPLDAACVALLETCRTIEGRLFAPPAGASIRRIRGELQWIAASDRPLVVLAVDAIPYWLVKELWQPDRLIPLASVFPSTSSVAWP